MSQGPVVRPFPGGIEIDVVVSAGAKRSGVTGTYGEALKVAVRAAPERGRANAEVIEVVAKWLAVSVKAVVLVSGHTSRRKRIRVTGIMKTAWEAQLATLIPSGDNAETKFMLRAAIVFAFAAQYSPSFAKGLEPSASWQWTYSRMGDQAHPRSIVEDRRGNLYTAGVEMRRDIGEWYNWLSVKLDARGSFVWSRSENGNAPSSNDFIVNASADESGNLVVLGYEERGLKSVGHQATHLVLRKYAANGDKQWEYTRPILDQDSTNHSKSIEHEWRDVKVGNHGAIVACGGVGSPSLQSCYVTGFRSTGEVVWSHMYKSASGGTGTFVSLLANQEGTGWYVLGHENRMNWSKYQDNCSIRGFQHFALAGFLLRAAVARCELVAGASSRRDTYWPYFYSRTIIKFIRNDGTLILSRTIDDRKGYLTNPIGLCRDAANRLYVASQENCVGYESSCGDSWWKLQCLGSDGSVRWTRTEGGVQDCWQAKACGVAFDNEGHVIIVGSKNWCSQIWSTSGSLVWSGHLAGPDNAVLSDYATGIVGLRSGGFCVCGLVGDDWAVKRYSVGEVSTNTR